MLRPQFARFPVDLVTVGTVPEDPAADDGQRLRELRIADQNPFRGEARLNFLKGQEIHLAKATPTHPGCKAHDMGDYASWEHSSAKRPTARSVSPTLKNS